jgi:hypothetical protein
MSTDAELDDLLNEVESALAPAAVSVGASASVSASNGRAATGAGGVSAPLLPGAGVAACAGVGAGSGAGAAAAGSSAGAGDGRCTYLCLGPADVEAGATRSLTARRACPSLRCTACDFRVLQFRGGRAWAPTVDYLFLRNVYPNADALGSRLAASPGGAAYCCQCSWVTLLPSDGAVVVRRPGGVVTPATLAAAATAAGAEPAAPPVRAGRCGGQGWAQWSCAGSHESAQH